MSNEGEITDARLMLGGFGGRTTVLGSVGNGDLDQGTVDALLGGYSYEDVAAADPKPGDPLITNPAEPLIGAYVDWPSSGEIDQGGTLVFCIANLDPAYTYERNKEPLDAADYDAQVSFTQHGDLVLIACARDPWAYGLISQTQGEGYFYIEKQSGAKAKLSGGIDQVFVMAMPAGHSVGEFAGVFGPFYKDAFGGGVKIKDEGGTLIKQYGGL